MVLEGLGVVFSPTLGAIEALGVLFNDHWVVLEGPDSRGGVQWYIIVECTPASINLSCILYEMLGICKVYT